MARDDGVRFRLFGGLKAYKDGREVELPDKTVGTYLRLLLLSGGLAINNGEGRRLGTSESIRTLVDKANRPLGRSGQYHFKGKTGLELRFRENVGIVLEGGSWSSDILEFEEVWRRRSTAGLDELRRALAEFDDGLSIESWPKTPVFNASFNWVRERVDELQAMGEDLVAEISARSEATERNQGDGAEPMLELKDETKSQTEISGLSKRQNEPEIGVKPSTPLGEELCQPEDDRKATQIENESPFAPDDPWVLTWLYQDGDHGIDREKLDSLRNIYQIKTEDDALVILEQAGDYAREMFQSDPHRGDNLFVEPSLERIMRFGKRFFPFLRRDDLLPSLSPASQAMYDSYHVKGLKHETWFTTIAREQRRRDTTSAEPTHGLVSFGEKRFIRACALRACRSLESRAKQLRDNQKRSAENRNLLYVPAYEGEIDRMIALVLGVVHLQGYTIAELKKVESKKGGIDPRSLTLRPGESLEDRRNRASKQVWEAEVLLDAIAVPDWTKPVARSLHAEHGRILRCWADERDRIAEKQRRHRESEESLPTDKPTAYHGQRETLLLEGMSIASSWLTIIGCGVFTAMQFEPSKQLLSGPITLVQVGQTVMGVALGAWPIWIPMSHAFLKSYSNAALDGTIRSALGFWTLLLACSLIYLVYFVITRL
ncbi:MAG TPA: hypothetical protein DCQ94_06770 [Nitrospira sp.]|nr:hypothetical protein [Nitrospira sp.]